MMRGGIKYHLILVILCMPLSCNSSQPEITDPDAIQFDSDDQVGTISPEWSIELDEQIGESSGLIFWNGGLWTMNDDSDPRLYQLDTLTGEITGHIYLWRVVNRDWEEIAQDDDFIYVGDFGNNSGSREDLHILRIDKSALESGQKPNIDSISFSYGDQVSFTNPGLNQTDFDCEAFVVTPDSIYLFTKQWLSAQTTKYSLPKVPGTYVAQKCEVFDTQGMVTGASYLEEEGILMLSGYAGFVQPFVYLFYDFQDYDFFSGTRKKVNINLPFHQIEGIATRDGSSCYLSNEISVVNDLLPIPQKLHYIDLKAFLKD